jgi:hypothetical protein
LIVKTFHAQHLLPKLCNLICKLDGWPFYITCLSRINININNNVQTLVSFSLLATLNLCCKSFVDILCVTCSQNLSCYPLQVFVDSFYSPSKQITNLEFSQIHKPKFKSMFMHLAYALKPHINISYKCKFMNNKCVGDLVWKLILHCCMAYKPNINLEACEGAKRK